MAEDVFRKSLWSAVTPAGPDLPRLEGAVTVDVVVVGAGLLGLSTALHLAEAGARVALIEGTEPGYGASGRNTGFVVPSLKAHVGPEAVRAALGPDGAERLYRLVDGSAETLFSVIDRLGIDCSAERTGWIQPAHSQAMVGALTIRAEQAAARGRPVRMLDAAETARVTGMTGYAGALLDPSGGQLNPLALVRGLVRAAHAAGVQLFARSPVEHVARTGAGFEVRTAHGTVRAERVILTTNALTGKLCPALSASFVPVFAHQMVTERLDPAATGLLPTRLCLADTRRHTFALRWSPDNRLMTGGITPLGPFRLARTRARFARRLAHFLPGKGPFRPAFAWWGVIAHTADSLPRLHEIQPGLIAAIGCNGRGVALTTAYGRMLAGFLNGTIPLADMPVPITEPRPMPHRLAGQLGPSLWLPWSSLRDWIDARSVG